jgi:hypothetical protein
MDALDAWALWTLGGCGGWKEEGVKGWMNGTASKNQSPVTNVE